MTVEVCVYIAINKQIADLHIRVQTWIHMSTFTGTDASIQLQIILLTNVPAPPLQKIFIPVVRVAGMGVVCGWRCRGEMWAEM